MNRTRLQVLVPWNKVRSYAVNSSRGEQHSSSCILKSRWLSFLLKLFGVRASRMESFGTDERCPTKAGQQGRWLPDCRSDGHFDPQRAMAIVSSCAVASYQNTVNTCEPHVLACRSARAVGSASSYARSTSAGGQVSQITQRERHRMVYETNTRSDSRHRPTPKHNLQLGSVRFGSSRRRDGIDGCGIREPSTRWRASSRASDLVGAIPYSTRTFTSTPYGTELYCAEPAARQRMYDEV